jgi:hypothetical protein
LLVKTIEKKAVKNNVEMKSKSDVNVYKAMPKSVKQKLLDRKADAVRSTGGADKDTVDNNTGVVGTVVKDMMEELVVRVDNNCKFGFMFPASF